VSHMPLPPPIFFDILACPVVNIGHATSFPRFLYYVCVVTDVLEGTLGYGEHVHPPPLLVPPSDRSVGFPYLPNLPDTRVEGI